MTFIIRFYRTAINKNALTRIVLLDKLLANRYHAYSIQNMTDYLIQKLPDLGQDSGVSKRCVEKDIKYLELLLSTKYS